MSAESPPSQLLDLLEQLLGQARRHDRQWVQPLKRIQHLLVQQNYGQAHAEWLHLLQPMRGSFHEFFVYCADLDQMRELNRHLDEARQQINILLTQLASDPGVSTI